MSLDTTRPGPRPGGTTVREARERPEHERASRLARLAVPDDALTTAQRAAAQRVREDIEDIDAAFAHPDGGAHGSTRRGCAGPVPAERTDTPPYARRRVACRQRLG
ncbi:molecular chaperone DnaK [Streptomyces macrosporus]|uniref:Uncharacterized protein n=1 Tax=Streptomyces macrosporus TaxID=44032 RepID=A0ABP5WNK7_9ACTN